MSNPARLARRSVKSHFCKVLRAVSFLSADLDRCPHCGKLLAAKDSGQDDDRAQDDDEEDEGPEPELEGAG